MVVKGQDWNVDFTRGILSFGRDEYPVQLIGTESSVSNTWLWGWENVNGFDEKIIKFPNIVKNIGTDWGLEALTVSEFDINDIYNGHNIAIISTFLSRNKFCYYRGPHSNGAVLMAFNNVPKEVFAPVDLHKFSQTILAIIQQYNVNHEILVESYLMWNGTKYEWESDKIIAHFKEDLCIEFEKIENSLRIKTMTSVLK